MDAFKVAILNCDAVVSPLQKRYPSYSSMFIWRLQAAMQRSQRTCSDMFEFSEFDVRAGEYPSPSSIDGLIITGSGASAYDTHNWTTALARYTLEVYQNYPHVKIFGACFGHQMIAHALLREHGVLVEKNPAGRQWGIRTVTLQPDFCSHFTDVAPEMGLIRIQVIHGDHVNTSSATLPPGWMVVGRSDCCEVHGLYLPGRVLTLQGHFEFDEDITSSIIRDRYTPENGWPDQEVIAAALERTKGPDDAEIATDVLISFFASTRATREPSPPYDLPVSTV